ncbi:MAG: SDR family oxidoreductase [Beijerinckiaceae bacterium]
MDLGIKGRKAIICASSRGLGRACATELAAAGCDVVINGRDEKVTNATADEIRKATGAKVTIVLGDVSTKAAQEALIAACPEPDILVNNNGGPPPKGFRDLTREAMADGVIQNMITPIELIQRVIDGMIARKFGRIVNIVSSSVKAPIVGLDLSSGARAGLIAFLAAAAREVAPANVTINHILPGMFDTDRLRGTTDKMASLKGVTVEEMAAIRQKETPAGRFGTPDEFGKLCAFLASAHAGYINGQSILIDGGAIKTAF